MPILKKMWITKVNLRAIIVQSFKKIRAIPTLKITLNFHSDENANFRKTLYQHSYARFEGSKSNKHNL